MPNRIQAGAIIALASAIIALVLAGWLITPFDDNPAPLSDMQKSLGVGPRVSQLARQLAGVAGLQNPLTSSTSTAQPSFSHRNNFNTTSSTKMPHDSTNFKEAVQHRRSIYQLTKKSPIADDRIKEILTTAIEVKL